MAQISSGAIFIRLEPFIGCPKCCLAKISWSFSGPFGAKLAPALLVGFFSIFDTFWRKRAEEGKRQNHRLSIWKYQKIQHFEITNKNNDETNLRKFFLFCFGILKCLLSPALKNNIILSIYVPKQFHKFNHHMFQHHLQPFKPLFFELMLTPVLDMDWMLMITTTLLLKILDKLGIGELVIKILRSCFAPLAGMFLEILFMHQSLLFFSTPFLSSQSSFIVKTFFISDGRRSKEKYRVQNIPTKITAGSSNFWCLWFV